MIPEPIPKDTDFASVSEKYRSFIHRAADLVISYGGSLSGKHRDGQSRGELLPKMFGPELIHAFHEFKAIRDPDLEDEPRKSHRSPSRGRQLASRRRLSAAAGANSLQVSR